MTSLHGIHEQLIKGPPRANHWQTSPEQTLGHLERTIAHNKSIKTPLRPPYYANCLTRLPSVPKDKFVRKQTALLHDSGDTFIHLTHNNKTSVRNNVSDILEVIKNILKTTEHSNNVYDANLDFYLYSKP